MQARLKNARWIIAAITVVATLVAFRYVAAIQTGVPHLTAIRTYAFWALVTTPVAYLADTLIRTALDYRIVRLTLARVQSRR